MGPGEAAAPGHSVGRACGQHPGRVHHTKSTAARGWRARGAVGRGGAGWVWGQEGRDVRDQGLWRPGLGSHEDQPGWQEGLT